MPFFRKIEKGQNKKKTLYVKQQEYNQYKNMLKDPNLDAMVTLIEWMTKE
jgi:hypothetical protein